MAVEGLGRVLPCMYLVRLRAFFISAGGSFRLAAGWGPEGGFCGNGGEWAELLNNKRVKNRGISGDICQGVYDRLDPILKGKPAKIFPLT